MTADVVGLAVEVGVGVVEVVVGVVIWFIQFVGVVVGVIGVVAGFDLDVFEDLALIIFYYFGLKDFYFLALSFIFIYQQPCFPPSLYFNSYY